MYFAVRMDFSDHLRASCLISRGNTLEYPVTAMQEAQNKTARRKLPRIVHMMKAVIEVEEDPLLCERRRSVSYLITQWYVIMKHSFVIVVAVVFCSICSEDFLCVFSLILPIKDYFLMSVLVLFRGFSHCALYQSILNSIKIKCWKVEANIMRSHTFILDIVLPSKVSTKILYSI